MAGKQTGNQPQVAEGVKTTTHPCKNHSTQETSVSPSMDPTAKLPLGLTTYSYHHSKVPILHTKTPAMKPEKNAQTISEPQ